MMSEAVKRWVWFPDLVRFAEVLSGSREKALSIVREALDEILARRHGHLDEERGRIILFRSVRTRALKHVRRESTSRVDAAALPAGADIDLAKVSAGEIAMRLHELNEPGRSAFALLVLDAMDAEAIGKLLGLGIEELADIVQKARVDLHTKCRSIPNKPGIQS